MTPSERDEGRRLLDAMFEANISQEVKAHRQLLFERWAARNGAKLLRAMEDVADPNAIRREAVQQISAALLAKMRSKQFACEQSNLGPEASWWAEAQRLLGEVVKEINQQPQGEE